MGPLNKHLDELTTGIALEFTRFVKKLIVEAHPDRRAEREREREKERERERKEREKFNRKARRVIL